MAKRITKLFVFFIIIGVLSVTLISIWTDIFPVYIAGNGSQDTPTSIRSDTRDISISLTSIVPIRNSSHFAVSAFIDHRFYQTIRVISIIKRDHVQPLYCLYCIHGTARQASEAKIEIHSDHFRFPFGAADVLCESIHTPNVTHVALSTKVSDTINNLDFLSVKNKKNNEIFKYEFTVCISNLFGKYNNVLQFVQTMEMYKLLGVQQVVIYNTSCGSDLKKLLHHYEKEGILEIVPWPIDHFLNPSAGWNITLHKGDLHYYGQLVTLNECIYRQMYQSKYVLLNDIDEIIMPYKYANLASLMKALEEQHNQATVFLIENHIFPKTQFEESGKFSRPAWKSIPGINIMEHVYREPDRKNIYNPTKMIINPRSVIQTSVHTTLKHTGEVYRVPPDVCRIVHVRTPLQGSLTKEQLFVDTRVWDFEQELIPNVDRALHLSGLLETLE